MAPSLKHAAYMNVVIVESPAKAKTINKYLGPSYRVLASYGHVRDLPSKNGSVDPDHDFAMLWEVDGKSQKRLSDIASAIKDADRLILATDPDREGEAISWHVLEVLKNKKALGGKPVERVVFNAVTRDAVLNAMNAPRKIDDALVDAYLARRALDYLVGYLSPVLWRSCRVPARPAACNRWRSGWSATARTRSRSSSRASTGPSRSPSNRRTVAASSPASLASTVRSSAASTSPTRRLPGGSRTR